MRTLSQKLIDSCSNGLQSSISDISTDQLLEKVEELATDYLGKPLASWTTSEKKSFENFFETLRVLLPNENANQINQNIAGNVKFLLFVYGEKTTEKVPTLMRRL